MNAPNPAAAADLAALRDWLLSFVPVTPGAGIVDLGCGSGEDLVALARRHPHAAITCRGLDASAAAIGQAVASAEHDRRVTFARADLTEPLPFASGTVDAVLTSNVLECLPSPAAFAQEMGRILKPGGTLVAFHWDWDTQTFDGADKARVRRLLQAFADWQQPWMRAADGWMGRRQAGLLAATGLFRGSVHGWVLTNSVFAPPWYGHARAQDIAALASHGLASSDDANAFLQYQADLQARGQYVYSLTGFAYVARRRDRTVGDTGPPA